ncbi:hypothetical protein [Paenibacillus koleovorans]|uniref:hypothetical protein n=1 Tax=Paenibacillus koleovorans TaxID=121608 RepID=UPI000FD9317C|nr:hypothetical protein [Paenibacillus koleovorans]
MIHLIWSPKKAEALWRQGRDAEAPYWAEILKYAGLAYHEWTLEAWREVQPEGLTLIAELDVADAAESAQLAALFTAYCARGNAILVAGGTHGLDATLGVKRIQSIREGWIDWAETSSSGASIAAATEATAKPSLAQGLRSSFHFFGATLVELAAGAAEEVEPHGALLPLAATVPAAGYPAVTIRDVGPGAAALLAVDLPRTCRLIQDGVAVLRDAVPAPDGTAAICDDILKADDGGVLDWDRDRDRVEEEGAPFFLHPIVDEFRVLLLRLLHHLHARIGRPLAQLWFWPEGLEAIGHISHDTDGNDPAGARMMLDRLREAGIRSSWCTIMPGYDADMYRRIVAEGHEIAMHYNALEAEGAYWDEELYRAQLAQLRSQLAVSHPDPADADRTQVIANKNHYLRWEGDVQFYRWCEKSGIVVEQSKGGTKQGNKGFLAGTCHLYRPVSTPAERNRLMNVYANPTLAWDPPMPIRCTQPEAQALIDRSADVYGVAHFLFHPATMLAYEPIGPNFVDLVRYGTGRGLAWWTARELYEWQERRNGVSVDIDSHDDAIVITAQQPCKGLTLLLPEDTAVDPDVAAATAAGIHSATIRCAQSVTRFGIRHRQWILDIPVGVTRIPLQKSSDLAVQGSK